MKYKLIVSDFDNTLADHNRKVSERTKKAIKEYQKAGGKFILCTGRMFPSARKEGKNLALTGECIAYNGALTGDIETGKITRREVLKKEVALKLVQDFEKMSDVVLQLYFNDKIYVQYKNPYTDEYVKECNLDFCETKEALSRFIQKNEGTIMEVLVMAHPNKILSLYEEYRKIKTSDYTVVSSEVHFLEFISPEANKGIAVQKMCAELGVDKSEVACFGDNYNDVYMIEFAGLGVAVANGVDELKNKADLICPSNDEDGVAQIIEKITKGEDVYA